MLATRSFWFRPPVRYDPSWSRTLDIYRQQAQPWPLVPEPSVDDYVEHLLLTKDSAPGPDGFLTRYGACYHITLQPSCKMILIA